MLSSQGGKGGPSLVTKPRNITFNAWRGEYSVQFLYLPLEIIVDKIYRESNFVEWRRQIPLTN